MKMYCSFFNSTNNSCHTNGADTANLLPTACPPNLKSFTTITCLFQIIIRSKLKSLFTAMHLHFSSKSLLWKPTHKTKWEISRMMLAIWSTDAHIKWQGSVFVSSGKAMGCTRVRRNYCLWGRRISKAYSLFSHSPFILCPVLTARDKGQKLLLLLQSVKVDNTNTVISGV